MPAKSEAQRNLMKMVYAYKKGSLKLNNLPKSLARKIKEIAKGISTEQASHFTESLSFVEWTEIIKKYTFKHTRL